MLLKSHHSFIPLWFIQQILASFKITLYYQLVTEAIHEQGIYTFQQVGKQKVKEVGEILLCSEQKEVSQTETSCLGLLEMLEMRQADCYVLGKLGHYVKYLECVNRNFILWLFPVELFLRLWNLKLNQVFTFIH